MKQSFLTAIFLALCAGAQALPGERRDHTAWPARIQLAAAMLKESAAPATLAASPALEKHQKPYRFDVDVTGLDHVWVCTNDGGDGFGGDHTCWVDPVLTRPDGSTIAGTDLPVLFCRTGWEKFYPVVPGARRFRELVVADTVYTNGWWIHPNSAFCLKLDKRFTRFTVGGGTHLSAHGGGKVGFSLERALKPQALREVLADNLAREFPDVDRWIATDLKTDKGGHDALFALPPAEFSAAIARLSAPHALDRLACLDALSFARRTLALVARAKPLPAFAARLVALEKEAGTLGANGDWPSLLVRIRALRRETIFAHPALDFADLLVTKRPPPRYPHQCDQYLGQHNNPGPGLVVLKNWKSAHPEAVELLAGKLPRGSVAHPDLSFDAKKIVFAFSDCTPTWHLRRYHLWEINADGTGLHPLTGGANDPMQGKDGRRTVLIEDFDPCYLPDGGIVFVSTRCQSFGRCHAGRYNPSYLLYRMNGDGSGIRQLSFGEANEWDPSVLPDGRIIYTRWDYINRHDTFYQSLWTTHPDGTGTAHFYGNYTINPCMTAEARAIPGTAKVVSTATAHHGYTSGSLVIIDPSRGEDGPAPLTRLTPEVAFPETETSKGDGAYNSPWPLCEDLLLAAYTDEPANTQRENAYRIVLIDSLGGREEIHRDPNMSTFSPIPLAPRPVPHRLASALPTCAPDAPGRILIQNANKGTHPFDAKIHAVRVNEIIGQPTANVPHRGIVRQEIVKRTLGTADVAADGSAAFAVPSGKPFQLQVLDEHGMAVMTMRSFIYAQPGETLACVGCHEPRSQAPVDLAQKAVASVQTLKPLKGQEYAEGFSYPRSVQPILDRHCVKCHGGDSPAAGLDLCGTPEDRANAEYPSHPNVMHLSVSYNRLIDRKGLVALAQRNEESGSSRPRDYFAAAGRLAPFLLKGHCKTLLADRDDLNLIITWLDLNAQFYGDYSWSHDAAGAPTGPADGTCGLTPCRCGCCWVKHVKQK